MAGQTVAQPQPRPPGPFAILASCCGLQRLDLAFVGNPGVTSQQGTANISVLGSCITPKPNAVSLQQHLSAAALSNVLCTSTVQEGWS